MLQRIMLEESFDITLVRVLSMVLMLTRFLCVLRVQLKVKDEPEDVFEKIMGTGTCDDC